MKRLLSLAMGTILLTLWATSAALAIDAPHSFNCFNCHNNPSNIADLSNAVGVVNVCLSCHNPAVTVKAFSPKDLANPFGSTVLGVYTSGRKQTSHNWYAPVNVPAAGATAPQSADASGAKLLITLEGKVNCGTCHDPHNNANGNFLRIPNGSDQLCLDCHRSRNTTDHTKGTHPVTVNYAAAVATNPAEFYSPPRNANPANPTSSMKLIGGQVLCSTCHGIHHTDSNARTLDNFSSSTFGRLSSSPGYLLRTDMRGGTANAVNICTNCHAGKLAHNNKGQNVQCADCHGGHVDPGDGSTPNVWLVRRYMNYSGGVKIDSYRRKVLNQAVGSQSNWAGAYGVCQTCHVVPPPGGSYPAEHASTDPDVCRGCHTHESTYGSFSANCTGCHGFPPQQNTAGGPLGYAKTTNYDYKSTTAFKDESQTPHFAHAGKAPYAYGCSECHLGNKHATGNFQQVFNTKTGIIAATGGAVPTYSTASPGTCSNVYCHSNGAGAYKSPTWAGQKGSIVGTTSECSACHDAAPSTSAHPGHLSYGFNCSFCHSATVNDAKAIIDTTKHVNGVKDVKFSGTATIGGTGSYDGTAHTCMNLYCHSNGNQGALVYANPAAWNSGANYGCNGCHGTSNSIGAPDYANGGAGTMTANTHGPHVTGSTSTTVCASCHFVTASSTTGGALVANSKHLNGTVNVVFNPATAGPTAAWDPATSTCTNVACHGGAPAQWGSTAACLTCHAFAVNGRAAIGAQFGANSHHVQGSSVTAANCYQCHWEANSDGSINHSYHHSSVSGSPVELVIYGAGIRPTAYGTATAIQYTANGTRAEIAKINSHCLGCHSDQNNATQPFGDGKTPSAYAWDKNSIATKYGDTGTTPWGKYSGGNVTPKNTVTKAFSAHGNAGANQAGWNTSETWPNTTGSVAVLCFDCHNSHGSTVSGTTTSYTSATTNGGILKDTVAGKGGYSTTYQPKAGGTAAEHNLYNPGAGLCFDCHQNASSGATPWGYASTFSASQAILGYLDTPYFGTGQFGYQMRNPYKITVSFGGHLGATSPLSATPSHAISGLCTPCHDPHGVSPTLGSNKQYGVPLLKGTWMTSPYKEDNCTADNATYGFISGVSGEEKPRPASGAYTAYLASTASYKIDQNTFTSGSITETDQQFAGLCLNCHAKQTLTNGATHTWKSKDRIHESVKGWKTANGTIKHNYSCSKCHAPHNAQLPRLMITNCLDYKHRGRVTNNANPKLSFSYRGDEGSGGGHIPGIYSGRSDESDSDDHSSSGTGPVNSSFSTCHEGNTGSPTDQYWNVKTPWTSGAAASFLPTPMIVAEPDAICSGSCGTQLQWNAVTNPGGGSVQYSVQVSSSSTFATVNYSSGWISGTSYTRTLTNGTWYWRVQARDSSKTSVVSAWSNTDTFIMATTLPPSKPMLIAEPDASCSGSCATQLQWNTSTNASGNGVQYMVQVSNDISFATINYSSGWISGTSYTPTLANGTWYWRVQARDSVKTTSVSIWSLAGSFTLSATPPPSSGPTVPVLITVPNATCSGSCASTLQWNASSNSGGGPVQYMVQVSSSSTFVTVNYSSGWISGTSYTPTLSNGTWYWRAQARDSVTTTKISAWSAVGSFTLSASTSTNPPTTPVFMAEPDSSCSSKSGCSIGLQWTPSTNPSGGAVQYMVQVSSSSSFSTIKASSSWQTGTSWTTTLSRGTWYWRVQARDAAVTSRVSPWSSVDSFRLASQRSWDGHAEAEWDDLILACSYSDIQISYC